MLTPPKAAAVQTNLEIVRSKVAGIRHDTRVPVDLFDAVEALERAVAMLAEATTSQADS